MRVLTDASNRASEVLRSSPGPRVIMVLKMSRATSTRGGLSLVGVGTGMSKTHRVGAEKHPTGRGEQVGCEGGK